MSDDKPEGPGQVRRKTLRDAINRAKINAALAGLYLTRPEDIEFDTAPIHDSETRYLPPDEHNIPIIFNEPNQDKTELYFKNPEKNTFPEKLPWEVGTHGVDPLPGEEFQPDFDFHSHTPPDEDISPRVAEYLRSVGFDPDDLFSGIDPFTAGSDYHGSSRDPSDHDAPIFLDTYSYEEKVRRSHQILGIKYGSVVSDELDPFGLRSELSGYREGLDEETARRIREKLGITEPVQETKPGIPTGFSLEDWVRGLDELEIAIGPIVEPEDPFDINPNKVESNFDNYLRKLYKDSKKPGQDE